MGSHQTRIGLESLKGVNWKNKKVLDIGCGDGKLTSEVLKKTEASEIIGIDISKEQIRKAKAIFKGERKLKFYFADASNLKRFKENCFDAVFCNIAFQQFKDKEKALKEMFRVLKKGGEVRINYIEEKSELLQKLLGILTKLKLKSKGIKRVKISRKEFEKMAKRGGFSRVKVSSQENIFYFKDVYGMLNGYRETINSKISKFSKEVRDKVRRSLIRELELKKTKKGFPDRWKIVVGRLVK